MARPADEALGGDVAQRTGAKIVLTPSTPKPAAVVLARCRINPRDRATGRISRPWECRRGGNRGYLAAITDETAIVPSVTSPVIMAILPASSSS